MPAIDRFGIQMLKPTHQGGETWTMNNADFNNDSQVYTFSSTSEYGVSDSLDDAGVRWTLSTVDPFYVLISSSRGFDNSSCTDDQDLMTQRGYMQTTSDWKNVEFTANFRVFVEDAQNAFIRIGFRGAKHQGAGAPTGCTGSNYAVEIPITSGGVIRVRKESWHASFFDWLSTQVSGFNATIHPCGFTIKVLCYNTPDNSGVTVEVWLDRDNENRFELVLSGTDFGQINDDASQCGCANVGQPLVWGSPTVLLSQVGGGTDINGVGTGGKIGWKNASIREIDAYGTGATGGTPSALDKRIVIDPPAVSNRFTYQNGELWSKAKVHFIFWGADWNTRTNPYGKNDLQKLLKTLFTYPKSYYFDYLIEYGIKRPVLGVFAINSTYKLPSDTNSIVTVADIEAVVKDSITVGLVPANVKLTDRNLYFVITPFSFSIAESAAKINNPKNNGHFYYPYPIVDNTPLPKFPYAWSSYAIDIPTMTTNMTKQLIHAISDPVPFGGIVSRPSPSQASAGTPIAELCDTCTETPPTTATITTDNIKVSKYFSNALGECWAPTTPVPFVTCKEGTSLLWNSAAQTCKQGPGIILPESGPGQLPPVIGSTEGANSLGIVGGGGALRGVEYQVGYRVVEFKASSEDGLNVAKNAGDGYQATRWSAYGIGQWIKADLGANKNVNVVKIAWYRGESRVNDFQIHTSTDNLTYTLALTTSSISGSSALQSYTIGFPSPISCRYVAITNLGNSENNWISITEVQVWGPDVPVDVGASGGTGTGSGASAPPANASYNFLDTSFSLDYNDIGLCQPLAGG